jgi:hypothetical protein
MYVSICSIMSVIALAAAIFIMRGQPAHAQAACTHYASPTGTGNGSSSSQPFKIASFWPVAKPGYTLCLLDGEYTGSASMINPPKNLSGTASGRITVRALNDGKVRINGQGSAYPVQLSYNNYFIIEGINASNSAASVVSISNSNNNIVRRVAAWDAADGNHSIFGIHYGSYNLLEDVAGWGIARKIYESSQGGDFTTIRRAWGRWEGSHVVGPKVTYSITYNNYHLICENCIGTWSGERMKATYTLLDYYGKPWTGNGAGTYTNYAVDQPYAIFGIDALTGTDKNARSKVLGSLAYVRASDRFHPPQVVFATKVDSVEIGDMVAYVQPGSYTNKRRFALYNLQTAIGTNLVARNLTGIGGTTSYFGSEWKKSSIAEGSLLSAIGSIFSSSSGAKLCYRYKDGALTSEPLWPWPMNQRIIDATLQSGRAAVDVTASIDEMLGAIPSMCKGTTVVDGPAPTPPPPTPAALNAPINLQVTP